MAPINILIGMKLIKIPMFYALSFVTIKVTILFVMWWKLLTHFGQYNGHKKLKQGLMICYRI